MRLSTQLNRIAAAIRFRGRDPAVVRYESLPVRAKALSHSPRICVLKLDMIGDFVVALPAMRKLRAAFPDAHIVLVCGSWNVGIARRGDYFDEVVAFDFWAYGQRKRAHSEVKAQEAFRRLELGHFDLALDFRHDNDTRFLTFLVDAKFRAGFVSRRRMSKLDLTLPNTEAGLRKPGFGTPLHASARMTMLTDAVVDTFASRIPASGAKPDHETKGARRTIAAASLIHERFVVIAPGAGQPIRKWPVELFAEIAKRILERTAYRICVVGSGADRPDGERIVERLPPNAVVNFAGDKTLLETMEIIKNAYLFIGNDAGLMHVAAAEEVPSVIVFSGAGDRDVWGPKNPNAVVLTAPMPCSPCYLRHAEECWAGRKCVTAITVEDVWAAVAEMLAAPDATEIVAA